MKSWTLGLMLLGIGISEIRCASTPYQKNHGRSGGYEDLQLDDRTFTVKFYGNHSSDARTRANLMRRCEELAGERGYPYFYLTSPVDGNDNEMTVTIRLTADPNLGIYRSNRAATLPSRDCSPSWTNQECLAYLQARRQDGVR